LKEELIRIIRKIGVGGARYIEENIDLQYYYIKRLYEEIKDEESLVKLVILNSLSSYQLSSKAEEWWKEFSEYFSKNKLKDILSDYIEFLRNSKTNKRFINKKIERIVKIKDFINSLELEKIYKYFYDMKKLRDDINKSLNVKGYSKTIVFSVKMFGYACRIIFKEFVAYPFEIDIPLDSRIIKFTKRFTDKNFLDFWREVSVKSGVPPLHIDSILWPFLTNRKIYDERIKELIEFLNNLREVKG